jgi:nucleotide-binding universal stress UspA family protein
MTEPVWMKGPPRAILLATDLSARCDRALDRALRLARLWGARLHVVHALEEDIVKNSRFSERLKDIDPVAAARARVEADIAGHGADIDIAVHVEPADPTALVLKVAGRECCGLIVTGVARDQSLGRYLLGSMVDNLVRHAPVPLLVVRSRANDDYRKIVVASDFSPSSRHPLEAAARLFPAAELLIFHAYDIPYSGYLENDEVKSDFARMHDSAYGKFLAEANLPAGASARVTPLIERGDPETLLAEYAQGGDMDLVVVGSHGGSALYNILIGSTAAAIIELVPGDILLVRDPAASR